MLTLVSFLVAIAVLVTVHEWGHFQIARACGVQVIRFSVGFGPQIFGWTSAKSRTEYVIGCLPLGGFVKMLDEREGPVADADLQRAFNRQSLKAQAAIVAAGPLANLVLAVLLYAVVHWIGIDDARARISAPPPQSIAALAGLSGGELVERVGFAEDLLKPVSSYEDLRWWLTRAALDSKDLRLEFLVPGDAQLHSVDLRLSDFRAGPPDDNMFSRLGFLGPFSKARLGTLSKDGAAVAAGLTGGDLVLAVDATPVVDAAQLRAMIRQSGAQQVPVQQDWLVTRKGASLHILVTPRRELDGDIWIGRVGAMIGDQPEMVRVRYGFWTGLSKAMDRTLDTSTLTLRMMGQMVSGQASIKNLSGPITIADYAGRSAAIGFTQYLAFLALVSISLGVLNLLPLPVLDGGHLMYYLWEGITGRAVSDAWMSGLQRAGVAILMMMMSVAMFNDLHRLFS
jgi:regulator of sigma E protease